MPVAQSASRLLRMSRWPGTAPWGDDGTAAAASNVARPDGMRLWAPSAAAFRTLELSPTEDLGDRHAKVSSAPPPKGARGDWRAAAVSRVPPLTEDRGDRLAAAPPEPDPGSTSLSLDPDAVRGEGAAHAPSGTLLLSLGDATPPAPATHGDGHGDPVAEWVEGRSRCAEPALLPAATTLRVMRWLTRRLPEPGLPFPPPSPAMGEEGGGGGHSFQRKIE